ncbi:MAG: family 16 glycosylhydrolase [Dysgonomonas sp.]
MKNLFISLFILSLFSVNCLAQTDDYKLVWSDEFDKDGKPDDNKWNYEHGFVRNQEQQWYQPQNIHCENGLMIITGKREQIKNPNYKPKSENWKENRKYANYSSGCVLTEGRQTWLYGRFEVRAKIPAVKGAWPAIWFRGDRTLNPWPLFGEIDLLEYYRVKDVPAILANAVYGKQEWSTTHTPVTHFTDRDKDWESRFHIWRMDWTEDYIRLYLDDELLNEIDVIKTVNPNGFNPFRSHQHLLINLAIGRVGESPDETPFPIKYEIDYVRVYQK